MSRLDALKIPLVGVLVAAVLGLGFFFGLSQPKAAERDALVAETADLDTQRAQLRLEIARLEEVRDAEEEIADAIARIDDLVPDGVEQPVTLELFEDAAADAAVGIASLTYEPPTPVEGAPDTGDPGRVLAAVPVTMVVEGEYFQTVDFFRRLETEVSRAVLVESVAVTEAEGGFPVLATTWTGRVFAVVDAPADAASEAAGTASAPTPAAGAEASTGSSTTGSSTTGDAGAPAPAATEEPAP